MNATTNWIQMNYTNIRPKVFFVQDFEKRHRYKKNQTQSNPFVWNQNNEALNWFSNHWAICICLCEIFRIIIQKKRRTIGAQIVDGLAQRFLQSFPIRWPIFIILRTFGKRLTTHLNYQQYSSRWTFFSAFHEFDIVHWFCRWNRFYQFCVVIDGCFFFLHSLHFCFSTLRNMNCCKICPRNCLGVFLTIFMEKLKIFFDHKRALKKTLTTKVLEVVTKSQMLCG